MRIFGIGADPGLLGNPETCIFRSLTHSMAAKHAFAIAKPFFHDIPY